MISWTFLLKVELSSALIKVKSRHMSHLNIFFDLVLFWHWLIHHELDSIILLDNLFGDFLFFLICVLLCGLSSSGWFEAKVSNGLSGLPFSYLYGLTVRYKGILFLSGWLEDLQDGWVLVFGTFGLVLKQALLALGEELLKLVLFQSLLINGFSSCPINLRSTTFSRLHDFSMQIFLHIFCLSVAFLRKCLFETAVFRCMSSCLSC